MRNATRTRLSHKYQSPYFKQIYPIDDFVYEAVLKEKGQEHLNKVIKISDVIRSTTEPGLRLVRPDGPTPFEEDFVAPVDCSTDEMDGDDIFYKPCSPAYEVDLDEASTGIANWGLMKSLQRLQLPNVMLENIAPKTEIIPALLALFPNLKCLGKSLYLIPFSQFKRLCE